MAQAQPIDRERRRPRPRIETLSDLIYGLSLSIGAISLVITSTGSTDASINKSILEFLFVFLILITGWIIYTGDMSVLPIETRTVIFLNIVLLLLVAIIPYLFGQLELSTNPSDVKDYASVLFTYDYAATLGIMAIFAHIIAIEEKQLVAQNLVARYRGSRNILFVLALVVLSSLAVPWKLTFLTINVRLILWQVPIAMFWFNQLRRGPTERSYLSRSPPTTPA